jgi:hypothetical protein
LGNLTGTNATGSAAVGNVLEGVFIVNAAGNTIGGTDPASRNVILGNSTSGVHLFDRGSTGNQVLRNSIGLDRAGKVRLGNGRDGVYIDNAPANTVGGTAPGAGNLISGNLGNGVNISGALAVGDLIEGNLIGTAPDGLTPTGNSLEGVMVFAAPGARIVRVNSISGNARNGVELSAGASGGIVQGNLIGTDRSGRVGVGNGLSGMLLGNAVASIVGGPAPGQGNVIAANGLDGVELFGASSQSNRIAGNFIGIDATGARQLGNAEDGVALENAGHNVVGGATPAEGNVIGCNASNGI